jgi:hypothetical protein
MALTVREIGGTGAVTLTIGPSDDGKLITVDNSLWTARTRLVLDAAVWGVEGWHVPAIKRIWNDPTPVLIEVPDGLDGDGDYKRADEFYRFVPLIRPMASVGLFVAGGKLWTIGSPWQQSTDHRVLAGAGTFQLGQVDRNCVVKCWPSAEGVVAHPPGNQSVILPSVEAICGKQLTLGQENPSRTGAYLWFANVDPTGTGFTTTVYPYSDPSRSQFERLNSNMGTNVFGLVPAPGVVLVPGSALGVYISEDGSRIISRTNVGF